MIDTPTEGMDDALNKEYRTRVATIIKEEKSYSDTTTKENIEKAIVTYVQTNAKDEGYVELPYYLIIMAKKAKIGDLQKYLFAYKDSKLVVCGTKQSVNDTIDFSKTNTVIQREYVT